MSFEANRRKFKPGDVEKNFMDEDIGTNFVDSSIQHDRVLVVEGKRFYVNSGFLSFSSEFFNTLFNGSFAEKNQQEIVLEEVAASDFHNFLSVIYPGLFDVNETNLECLMKLSARFLSPIVWKKCINFLEPEEKFEQFDMADLLKWSEASNSKVFKERIENYLIENLSFKTELKIPKTARLARDYNLVKVKEKIVMCLKNLLESGFLSERKFYGAVSIRTILSNESTTTLILDMWKSAGLDEYFLAYIGREFEQFKETKQIKMFENTTFSIWSPTKVSSKRSFAVLLSVFVHRLPIEDKTSELFTSVFEMCEKYNLDTAKKYVAEILVMGFKNDNRFTYIAHVIKFDLVSLKNLMQSYIKINQDSLTEETMNILLNTSPEVTKFALEALIKKKEENPSDIGLK